MIDPRTAPYAALVLRLALGVALLAHSAYLNVFVFTMPGTVAFFEGLGLPGALAWATLAVEAVSGAMLVLGARSREAALAALPFLLGAVWAHSGAGWLFTAPGGGWEYPLFWALALLVQAGLGDGAFALAPSRPLAIPGPARPSGEGGAMKLMIGGVWRGDVARPPPELEAQRAIHAGLFRGRIAADEAPEPGRYHLYASYACPFAHRAILARALLGLEAAVGMSVLHPRWNKPEGWVFGDTPLSTPDLAGNGFTHLHQAYAATAPRYTGKVTVPVLWDRARDRIASNESAEILRVLNDVAAVSGQGPDLYPEPLRPAIAALDAEIAADLAAGAYAVGGARDQAGYDAAIARLFGFLDGLEARLSDGRRFLHSDAVTGSDVLAFTPLVRFDAVYNPLFRASLRRLVDYPCLAAFVRRVHDLPGVAATVRFDHILSHYHDGDWGVANRRGIVPVLPAVDFRSAPSPG